MSTGFLVALLSSCLPRTPQQKLLQLLLLLQRPQRFQQHAGKARLLQEKSQNRLLVPSVELDFATTVLQACLDRGDSLVAPRDANLHAAARLQHTIDMTIQSGPRDSTV